MSHFVATVEWLRGDRRISAVMKNAGLGLTGVGVVERTEISYKPGEVVDEARVMRALETMIKDLDDSNNEVEIRNPKVLYIHEVK